MARKIIAPPEPVPADGGDGGPPLIVGIGASAGGLDAFKSFFGHMPSDTGLAFVLVQHLSPDHKSMLADLIGRTTAMPVIEAVDGIAVEANRVFVIPPDATMTIAGGRLSVLKPAPPRDRRRPIDSFLQSLAQDRGANAIGIILSGTGSDGTLGMAAIKECGGLTLAQAEYDSHALPGMPQSAAATGQVDDVLAVEAMPAKLIAYQRHLAGVAGHKDGDGVRTDAVSHMATIMGALRARSGHDFSDYKERTLVRRLQRRMQLLQIETPEAYIKRFREQPEELDRLFRELLIGVTQFFRDPAAFEALTDTVLRELVAGKGADDLVRVWVPGCATGQEAYTIAILLREAMDMRRARPRVQIFGTDIDDRAIAIARHGRYRAPLAGVSPEHDQRWFLKEGEDCCVIPEIREMCVFSTHSIIKDPPFSKLDLISCRNLLIYVDPGMQERVMRNFHYALKPGGRLFLGSSESATRSARLFVAQDKKHRIFVRREIAGAELPDLPSRGLSPQALAPRPPAADRIDRGARAVMEKYYPPHVVVDRHHQIVRLSGGAIGRFLEPAPGVPSFALFDMLRKPLHSAVRATLQDAQSTGAPARRANVPLRIDGKPHLVTLIAEPLAGQGDDAACVVLAFQDAGPAAPVDRDGRTGEQASEAMRALEQDLRTTRTQLLSTIDELEIANEEMRSSNEEYQSVNEEMQSSNEELETTKEEMQSVNEELQTINVEMISKNDQLTRLNSDIKNLLESTEIATLFLDEQLRIKSFTRSVAEIFSVRDTDIGRPITEIVSLLSYEDLRSDVTTVLRKLTMIERQVTLQNTQMTFMLRIRPYRTIDNVIDGVVVTLVDITDQQASADALRASEAKFRLLFESIDEGFCTLEKVDTQPGAPSDFRYLTANPGFAQQSGLTNVVGRTIRQIVPQEPEEWFDIYDKVLATGEATRFERELVSQGRTLEQFAFRFEDETGPKLGVIFLDVSSRKRHDEQQDLLLREMDHRVKNLFAIAGGIVSLSARSAATPEDMAAIVQGRLGALAGAHQLARPGGLGAARSATTLGEIVQIVLRPYALPDEAEDHPRTVIKGPEVAVGGDSIASVAMVLHELATNAAKYGALSKPGGRVHVTWSVEQGRLRLDWAEWGGPRLKGPPARAGFGTMLAHRSVSGRLGGELTSDWNPEGLTVHLSADTERLAQ